MRTAATVQQYRRLSNRLVRKFLAGTPNADLSSRAGKEAFAAWLSKLSHDRDWTKSAWRQARAAVVSTIHETVGEEEAQWFLSTINSYAQVHRSRYGEHHRWTARPTKAREVPEQELRALLSEMDRSRSVYAKMGSLWLRANLHVGLRPKEWASAQIDNEQRTLTVKNAKNTNGRSHGETRTLHLADLEDDQWQLVCTMAAEFARLTENQPPENLQKKVSRAIQRARNTLRKHGVQIRNISLYSARHQFVADLRASGKSPREIAAMLGHATTDTQREHYGLRVKGRRRTGTARADPGDVSRVRLGQDSLAEIVAWKAKHMNGQTKD